MMADAPEHKKKSTPKRSATHLAPIKLAELSIALIAFSLIIWIGISVHNSNNTVEESAELVTFILQLILVNVVLAGILYLAKVLFAALEITAREYVQKHLTAAGEAIEGFVTAHSHALENLVGLLVGILKIFAYCLIILIYIPTACTFFPRARPISDAVFSYILGPLEDLGLTLLSSLPDLLAIALYFFITSYLIKFMKFFSEAVSERQIQLGWLPAESAMSVYHILRLVVLVFFIVAVFRRLPGSDNAEFQVIAGFLALLVSLSSSSAVGNFVAGLVMTFMQPFKKGDRVKIGNVTGNVLDFSLVVTRIVTPKNERITIPNLAVLSGEVTNYTSYAATRGIGLSVEVTIGYDVKWQLVQELLLNAAEQTTNIEATPAPFVIQKELGDSAVCYELICYTRLARKMLLTRSELLGRVLDSFHGANVEILSPFYHAMRDGNESTVPQSDVPQTSHTRT